VIYPVTLHTKEWPISAEYHNEAIIGGIERKFVDKIEEGLLANEISNVVT
jgi:hypothetical protein